ncbi:hypothetical protein [Pseudomonas sp. S2_C03]
MKLTKFLKCISLCSVIGAVSVITPASATSNVLTATISAQGKVLTQTPEWISTVEQSSQPDYLANYKVGFKPGVFTIAPRFCSVSLIDTRSSDDLLHGQARLGAAPKQEYVTVITHLLGLKGPSGDSSQDFMLMCVN